LVGERSTLNVEYQPQLLLVLHTFERCNDWFRKFYRRIGPFAIVIFLLLRCLPLIRYGQNTVTEFDDALQFRTCFAANLLEYIFFSSAYWRTFVDARMTVDRMNFAISSICCSIAFLLASGALVVGSVYPGDLILLLEVSDSRSRR